MTTSIQEALLASSHRDVVSATHSPHPFNPLKCIGVFKVKQTALALAQIGLRHSRFYPLEFLALGDRMVGLIDHAAMNRQRMVLSRARRRHAIGRSYRAR